MPTMLGSPPLNFFLDPPMLIAHRLLASYKTHWINLMLDKIVVGVGQSVTMDTVHRRRKGWGYGAAAPPDFKPKCSIGF